MRETFVLRLGPESDAAAREFVGWIEEVDTARERRFRSTEQLLEFLSQCLAEARQRERDAQPSDPPRNG